MITETIHKPLHPAYFELADGERNFLCINPDAYTKDGKVQKSAHTINTRNNVLDLSLELSGKLDALKIGESVVHGVTIIVRIN